MTGVILMSIFVAIVATLVGIMFFVTRLLPESHPLRTGVNTAVAWVKANPREFEKRFKQFAFGLVVLVFLLLTIIYS